MLKRIIGAIYRKVPPIIRKKVVRFSQTKFTASVAAFVFNADGEILLLDHVLRPQTGWAIPGGFINSGEPPLNAIKREIGEETGLELKNIELFRIRTIGRHIEILFRAEAHGTAAAQSLEINRVGWFKVDALPERVNAAQKSLIAEISRADS